MASPTASDSNSFEDAENGNARQGEQADVQVHDGQELYDPAKPLIDLITPGEQMASNITIDGKSPSRSPSSRGPSKETSPLAAKGSPGKRNSALGKSQLSPAKSEGGVGAEVVEPLVALGVAGTDADTVSLVHGATSGEENHRVPNGDVMPYAYEDSSERNQRCSTCCYNPRCSRFWKNAGTIVVTAFASSVIVFCVLLLVLRPYMERKLNNALILRPEFGAWARPPVNMTLDVYFFDLRNPDKFMASGEKPLLRQMGPYSYRLSLEKVNVTWNENATVSYRERFSYDEDPIRTNGSFKDLVQTVNIPLVAVKEKAGEFKTVLEQLLPKEASQVVEQHTVEELLWGYDSLILEELGKLPKAAGVPDLPTAFGLLTENDVTTTEVFNVFTGADDIKKVNKIHSWNHERKLSFWATEEANEINGTDGSMFGPHLDGQELSIFYAQLYRSFALEYQSSGSLDGLDSLRYIIPDSQFSNTTASGRHLQSHLQTPTLQPTTSDPRRAAFTDLVDKSAATTKACTQAKPTGSDQVAVDDSKEESGFCVPKCVPSGAYSLEAITKVPVYISLPHFLGADSSYLAALSGLEPEEDKHRPIWDVDELTGVTISNHRRHQINVRIKNSNSEMFLPIVWMDLHIELGPEPVDLLKAARKTKVAVGLALMVALGVSVGLLTCSLGLIFGSALSPGRRNCCSPSPPPYNPLRPNLEEEETVTGDGADGETNPVAYSKPSNLQDAGSVAAGERTLSD